MYSLNYEMLTVVLEQYHYSGELQADIPPHMTELKTGGRVVLVAHNGIVVSSAVFDKNERKVYHDAEALHFLSKTVVLDWKLIFPSPRSTASTSSSSLVQSARLTSENTHRLLRARAISPQQMRFWPLLHRNVYTMCDGTHNAQQIATLLAKPLPVIEQVISDLQEFGVVEWR